MAYKLNLKPYLLKLNPIASETKGFYLICKNQDKVLIDDIDIMIISYNQNFDLGFQ